MCSLMRGSNAGRSALRKLSLLPQVRSNVLKKLACIPLRSNRPELFALIMITHAVLLSVGSRRYERPKLSSPGAKSHLGEKSGFPLAHHTSGVDTFDVKPAGDKSPSGLPDDVASGRLCRHHAAVVRPVNGAGNLRREAEGAVVSGSQKIVVFLLRTRTRNRRPCP